MKKSFELTTCSATSRRAVQLPVLQPAAGIQPSLYQPNPIGIFTSLRARVQTNGNTFNQNTTPDYLDGLKTIKRRSTTENVCYGAGLAYMVGHGIGGPWGVVEGLKHPEGTTSMLRINAVLNGVTKRGPMVANSLAVIAVMYNGLNGGIVALRPDEEDDDLNKIAAGALTGALFKATGWWRRFMCTAITLITTPSAGARPFVVGTVFGGCVTAAYQLGKRALESAGVL